MGLADWFRTFCGSTQVKNGATISSRYKNITKRLNTDFWSTTSDTAHSLYVGTVKLTDLVPNQRLGKSLSC